MIVLVLCSGMAVISGHPQEEMAFLDNRVFDKPIRTPAVFRHDEHNETAAIEECHECHHIYENGKKLDDESSEDQRCSDCHDKKDAGNKLALRKAFHKNCKGCHIQKKRGPVMCGECHRK